MRNPAAKVSFTREYFVGVQGIEVARQAGEDADIRFGNGASRCQDGAAQLEIFVVPTHVCPFQNGGTPLMERHP